MAFYLAAWFALLFVHQKLAKRQLVNLEYQHNIIDAISRIYVMNYVVDLKHRTLEIIRAPEEVHKIVKHFHGAEQTMNAITSYCIGKEYQAGMREITDINTLPERLKGKESLPHLSKNKTVKIFLPENRTRTVRTSQLRILRHFHLRYSDRCGFWR